MCIRDRDGTDVRSTVAVRVYADESYCGQLRRGAVHLLTGVLQQARYGRIPLWLSLIHILLPLSGLAGCGQIKVTTVSGAPEGPTIAIGVAADEPSVGAWHDGTYQGFDITIAKYVAAKLGYANKQIVFKQVRPENRRSMLDNGQVDMVVASWPITDESSAIVDFAGPYLTTSVGLLVRSDERGRFTNDAGSVGDVGLSLIHISPTGVGGGPYPISSLISTGHIV